VLRREAGDGLPATGCRRWTESVGTTPTASSGPVLDPTAGIVLIYLGNVEGGFRAVNEVNGGLVPEMNIGPVALS
jgi:hypothetical protein